MYSRKIMVASTLRRRISAILCCSALIPVLVPVQALAADVYYGVRSPGLDNVPAAPPVANLGDALIHGKFAGELRYRYENVDQQGVGRRGQASTLRTQLGYSTGEIRGLSAFAQVQNVSIPGLENFNSTNNGKTKFPTVADPSSTFLSRAFLNFVTPFDTYLRVGRQGINLDNQRFIGTVNFRQNEQTFDAFTAVNTSLPHTTAFYSHLISVNRVFGHENENRLLRSTEEDSELFNVAYQGFKPGKLTGYGYLFDIHDTPLASHKDVGVRFDGETAVSTGKVLYTAEYANQSPYAESANGNNADYYYLALGGDVPGLQVKLNYEVLSGNHKYAFQTPLASLHAFNGWADQFLTTPADGLRDAFVTVGTTVRAVNVVGTYHDFRADHKGYGYGQEFDFGVNKKVTRLLTLKLEYAAYFSDKNATNQRLNPVIAKDLDRLWLTADVVF